MSEASIYVRCRDGALYKNPLLIFEEGFVLFEASKATEAVLWLESTDAMWPRKDIIGVLSHVFGENGFALDIGQTFRRVERGVPLTNPVRFRPAICMVIAVKLRIPRPKKHEGSERYPGRCEKGARILDLPIGPFDAQSIELTPMQS